MAKKAAIIVVIMLVIIVFGYVQYASASQISAKIIQSKLLEKFDNRTFHSLDIEFNNPSFLVLTAGKTDFTIYADDEIIGKGNLEPFTIPALGKVSTNGTWEKYQSAPDNSQIKIVGQTKYQIAVISFDVPFVYYPTEDQTRDFISET